MKQLLRLALIMCAFFASDPRPLFGAGVTVITHGNNGTTDDWVAAMAEKTRVYPQVPGSNVVTYRIYFTQITNTYVPVWQRIGGNFPTTTDSGEIIIMLDWRDPVNDLPTTQVGPVLAYFCFLQTNFISELGGHALAEFPLHFIGHSRGGSLIAEMAKFLGSYGVWVDQLTFLDAFPVGSDGPLMIYENVFYADNYYQRINTIFAAGNVIQGTYNRKLVNVGPGGYTGVFEGHSDVHLWYHATIDLVTPTSDYNVPFTQNERFSWYSPSESYSTNAGFYYSRMGIGNRLSAVPPVSGEPAIPLEGYNRKWDFDAGIQNNRVTLAAHEGRGNWPSPITLALTSTNPLFCQQSNSITLRYQWADFPTNGGSVEFFLDRDHNPLNGNEIYAGGTSIAGTGQGQIGSRTLGFGPQLAGMPAQKFYPFVVMLDGTRRRYLYTESSVDWRGGCTRPTIAITRLSGSRVRLAVTASVGDRVVVERSSNLFFWQPVATNTYTGSTWLLTNTITMGNQFWRSVVQ